MPSTIHPTSRTLIAYLDGELPVEERHEIAAHLAGCTSCRSEMDAMETDLDWFLVLEAASRPIETPPPAGGWNQLLAVIREWKTAHPEAAASAQGPQGAEEKLAGAAAVLLGPAVARQSDASLLSVFLGKRAADTLVRDARRRARIKPLLAPDLS